MTKFKVWNHLNMCTSQKSSEYLCIAAQSHAVPALLWTEFNAYWLRVPGAFFLLVENVPNLLLLHVRLLGAYLGHLSKILRWDTFSATGLWREARVALRRLYSPRANHHGPLSRHVVEFHMWTVTQRKDDDMMVQILSDNSDRNGLVKQNLLLRAHICPRYDPVKTFVLTYVISLANVTAPDWVRPCDGKKTIS